jgi:hypothetical protein
VPTLAPKPKLEPEERVEGEFVGPFTRLTLTSERIVFSTWRMDDRSIRYDEVTRVEGGFSAGAHDLRDNSTVVYGIYVAYGEKRREEWAWIPRPGEAAGMIAYRAAQDRR